MIAAPRTAIVVGGGIAGIAAALRLSDAGVAVTLLETRKKLGGRATSFTDVRTGQVIDNCQHVAMGCCVNYLDLLDRLGVSQRLRWLEESFWVEAGGRTSVLCPGLLPAPGHFAGSFLAARFLSFSEKIAVARAMAALGRTRRAAWSDRVFSQWLADHSQPEGAIRKFWEPVIVSACNLPVDRVAASVALHVFQEGFLANRQAPRVGVAAVPLIELYDPAESALARAGGVIRLGVSVEQVSPGCVRTSAGEELTADAIICATPPERTARLVDDATRAADPRLDPLARVTHSPILGVHLTFDRPVLDLHSAVLVDRPTQWLFRKDDVGAHIHAVISAADEWLPLDEAEITRRVLLDINACFPSSVGAQVVSSRPVKEKLATYAPTPDNERLRPTTLGPDGLRGIILAGDFVQTGWPATMEGATRSGYMAAAAALGFLPQAGIEPPLPTSWVARIVAPALTR
jgi:zeta-carotene desaturase